MAGERLRLEPAILHIDGRDERIIVGSNPNRGIEIQGVIMSDSRFWRFVAAFAVAGVFYVGHGLHGSEVSLPSLDSNAFAGGVWGPSNSADFFTASEDGRVVYQWRYSLDDNVKFIREYKIPSSN